MKRCGKSTTSTSLMARTCPLLFLTFFSFLKKYLIEPQKEVKRSPKNHWIKGLFHLNRSATKPKDKSWTIQKLPLFGVMQPDQIASAATIKHLTRCSESILCLLSSLRKMEQNSKQATKSRTRRTRTSIWRGLHWWPTASSCRSSDGHPILSAELSPPPGTGETAPTFTRRQR